MNCKHCGSDQVGRKVNLILHGTVNVIGVPTAQGAFDTFIESESKSRELGLNLLHADIEECNYCFNCDKYQT